jgi:ABC-2 type transport system permease protein
VTSAIATRTVFWLTWRQLFARNRVWLAAVTVVLPFILTFFYRLSSEDNEGDRISFMMTMHRELVLGVLLPVVALVFGTTAFGGEVEDGTLVYVIGKPVPRWQIVLVKYLVSLVVTTAIVSAAVLLAWQALRNAELPGRFLWGFVIASAIGAAIYCAAFTFIGLVTRRGLLYGLLYVIFFENILARNFEGVSQLSAKQFTVSAAQWASNEVVKWTPPPVSMANVWIVGGVIVVASIVATMRRLSRYELAERL